jgi:Holliday junction resolvasome RuvABC endonuclease subunit
LKKKKTPVVLEPQDADQVILALDISSVCVGWALFEGQVLVNWGKYVQVGKHHGQRLFGFYQWLHQICKTHQPSRVIAEAVYPGRSKNAFGVLKMYQAILMAFHFARYRCEMAPDQLITPAVVKRIVGVPKGSTHEDRKRAMVKHINKSFGLRLRFKANDRTKKVSDDDIADAIAVGSAWVDREVARCA